MRVNEIVKEDVGTYIKSFVDTVGDEGFLEAFRKAKTDSRIRDVAEGWLNTWNVRLDQLYKMNNGRYPAQQLLQKELSQFVYVDMQVPQNKFSEKGIQELVDYSSVGRADTNKALNYMTALFTLSIIGEENVEPEPEVNIKTPAVQQSRPFGEPMPSIKKQVGDIVPVKWVHAEGTVFVKYDGLWFYDMDGSGGKFKLSQTPLENPGVLEVSDSQEAPVRIGPSGTRTLERLTPIVAQEWLEAQLKQMQGA
jgi:hypothetical protein